MLKAHSTRLGYADLVVDSPDDFQVHTSVYTDPQIFAAEMANIFEKTWVYVAHESEIPRPGDYKTAAVGRMPVIVSRGADRQVHVLLNVCRHRGSVVCREERGNSQYFQRPYHNWVYRNDGALVGIADRHGYPEGWGDRIGGLIQAPRVSTSRGMIFASFAESVSSGSLVAGMVNTDDVESSAVSRVGSRRPKWRSCTSRVGSIGTTIGPPARSSESGRTKSCSVPSIAPGPGSWPRLLPTRCRMTASRSMTRQEAEDFLYREARLLDSGQFETWLGLFAANGLYWIPINEPAEGNLYSAVVSSNGVYCLIGFHSRHACAAPYTRGQENILAQEEQRDEYDSASRCGLCPDGHTSP